MVRSSDVSAQNVKVTDAGLGPAVLLRTSWPSRVQDYLSNPCRLWST